MASFFEKLRASMGIEDIEEEKPAPKRPRAAMPNGRQAVKKIKVKAVPTGRQEENGKAVDKQEDSESKTQVSQEEFSDVEGELAVDVYQTDDEIVIQSAIAGVKPEDLDIAVERDTVTIRGERGNGVTERAKNYFHQECYWGMFSRQIILPEEVSPGGAEASMKNGILTLRLQKIERQKVKKVQVR